MAGYREEEDPFEEDIVFDQAGLLNSTSKMNTAIRRVSSGKCVLFAKTLGLCGAFFGLGLCIAIPGPTFLSPLVDLENNVSPVSTIYVARTSGYVVGSIIGGVLFDRFNRLFLLFLSLLLTAVFITVTPWCQVLWILETCMIILGITMGFLDTGGNVLCLDLWGRNSGPFMQALHFSFGLGAFVAPLLAAPFLEPTLANSTLNADFSHVITEFPVHLEDSKTMIFNEGKFKRAVESIKAFSDVRSDESVQNISRNLLLPDVVNTSESPKSPVFFSESSTFQSNVLSENFISAQHSVAKRRIPKHKPIKTDGSKLGNTNWDNVHVGIPPASDLLPLSTSSRPKELSSPVITLTETATTVSSNNYLKDPKVVIFHGGKVRRDIESVKNFSDTGNDENTENLPNNSLFPNITGNTLELPTSSVSFNENSTIAADSLSESFSNSVSTQSTSAKPRVPKHKPVKTDGSKLGTTNWDKIHVGIPPASDLLPLSTSSTIRPSFSPVTIVSAATTNSPDASTLSSSFSSTLTSTDSSSNDMSALSSVTTTDNAVPFTMVKQPTNIFPNGTEQSILSNSSSILTLPHNVLVQSPKPLSSVPSIKDQSINETPPFITSHLSRDNSETRVNEHTSKDNAEEFKERNITNNKTDNYRNSQVYPRRYENSSEMSAVPPLSRRISSGRMGTRFVNRKNILLNNQQFESTSQNFSSLQPDAKMRALDSLHEILAETSNHLDAEKAVFYNSKDPLPSSHFENTTPDIDSKNPSVSGGIDDNTMYSDTFTHTISDENIAFPKNEISTTYNVISTMPKIQNGEETFSTSTLEIASTLPTSAPVMGHSHHLHHKPGTFDNDTEHINTIFDIFANRIEKYGFNKIQFTYLIVGIFVFLISLVFLGFLCHNPRDPKSKQEGLSGKKVANKMVHKLLVPLMAFFFFLYMGLQVTYGQLVPAFTTHSNLQLSVVFWGSFAAMRFASIFFASGFSPLTMLMLNFAFCTSGTILVTALATYLDTALWVGTALIGIGLASMFPTGILWIERYIHVSNKVAAVFVIGVALGELICPLTIYHMMVIDRMLFMYAALVINIVCILTFILLWWLASRQGEKYSVINNNGYQLANQHDEEEDMMDMSPSGSGVMPRRHCFSSEHRSLLNGNIHRGP